MGIVDGSIGYRARGISIREKNVLSRNLGYKTRGGGRHMAKRSCDPRVSDPEVKLQVRDPVRVVGIVAPFTPLGAGTRGKFVLSSPREKMGTENLRQMPPAAVRHGRVRQT